MNQAVNGNRKLFWNRVSNVNGKKVESCNRTKDGNGKWHRERMSAKDLEGVF